MVIALNEEGKTFLYCHVLFHYLRAQAVIVSYWIIGIVFAALPRFSHPWPMMILIGSCMTAYLGLVLLRLRMIKM